MKLFTPCRICIKRFKLTIEVHRIEIIPAVGMEQEFFDFILIVEDLKAVQVKKLGCVRLGNPDLDFENLNPDFPIKRTLRSFESCRIKGTDESTLDKDSSVPSIRHDPNDLRVRSIGKSGFRFSPLVLSPFCLKDS